MILLRGMKRKPKPGLSRLFDRPKYRQCNIIERMFGWLKENRRIVTRFDKLAKSYAEMVSLACAMRCLRHYFSYSALVASHERTFIHLNRLTMVMTITAESEIRVS